mmetsp:Transcript_11303/g.34588  ORF Transcript_11303/g.34588 Transcript_11303/m.34588 type:complete len:232 (-) Transcript_11303:1842-2537(-)
MKLEPGIRDLGAWLGLDCNCNIVSSLAVWNGERNSLFYSRMQHHGLVDVLHIHTESSFDAVEVLRGSSKHLVYLRLLLWRKQKPSLVSDIGGLVAPGSRFRRLSGSLLRHDSCLLSHAANGKCSLCRGLCALIRLFGRCSCCDGCSISFVHRQLNHHWCRLARERRGLCDEVGLAKLANLTVELINSNRKLVHRSLVLVIKLCLKTSLSLRDLPQLLDNCTAIILVNLLLL